MSQMEINRVIVLQKALDGEFRTIDEFCLTFSLMLDSVLRTLEVVPYSGKHR